MNALTFILLTINTSYADHSLFHWNKSDTYYRNVRDTVDETQLKIVLHYLFESYLTLPLSIVFPFSRSTPPLFFSPTVSHPHHIFYLIPIAPLWCNATGTTSTGAHPQALFSHSLPISLLF